MTRADDSNRDRRVLQVALALLDEARPIIDENLRGLTDEEFLWEPVANCWSVRRRDEIRSPECWGRGDWVVEVSSDGAVEPAMTSIAWRLMHAYDCTSDFTSRAFGGGGHDWNEIEVPHTAAAAVALMRNSLDELRVALTSNADGALLGDPDPLFGRPRADMLVKALHEAIHHCAEIGVLRAVHQASSTAATDGPRITRVDDVEWQEVKAQRHGDRRVSVWEKYLEWSPNLMVLYARYDPGMLIERHGHKSDHIVYVLDGGITVGDVQCPAGTNIVLEQGAVFGPIEAGRDGALLLEVMMGDPRSVPVDPDGFAELLAARGITPLPNPRIDAPDWFGERTDSDPG